MHIHALHRLAGTEAPEQVARLYFGSQANLLPAWQQFRGQPACERGLQLLLRHDRYPLRVETVALLRRMRTSAIFASVRMPEVV